MLAAVVSTVVCRWEFAPLHDPHTMLSCLGMDGEGDAQQDAESRLKFGEHRPIALGPEGDQPPELQASRVQEKVTGQMPQALFTSGSRKQDSLSGQLQDLLSLVDLEEHPEA